MARKDDIDATHSWAETRRLNSRDMALRSAGFAIHARPQPGKGPVLWTRDGKTLTEAEALRAAGLTRSDAEPNYSTTE